MEIVHENASQNDAMSTNRLSPHSPEGATVIFGGLREGLFEGLSAENGSL